jgi:hypothetical protein
VGLIVIGCVLPLAVAGAERDRVTWLAVDAALALAEDCRVPVGSPLEAAEIAVLTGVLDESVGDCRVVCARNGTMA